MNKIMLATYPEIDYTMFYLPENGLTPFVVAWGYNEPGDYWSQGHYFRSLDKAIDFIRERKGEYPGISWLRMAEIATCALTYITNNGELEDFAEDQYIEFTEEEKEFFEINDIDDDDDWDFE